QSDFDRILKALNDKEYLTADDTSIACFNFTTPRGFIVIKAIMSAFVASLVFFGLCAVWAMTRLRRKTAQMSEKTRKLQLQFVRLLLLQMLSPVACMAVPVMYLSVGFIRAQPTPLVATYLVLLALSLFPMVNALLTIVFVRPYRQHALQLIMVFTKAHRISEVSSQDSWASQQVSATPRPVVAVTTRQVVRRSVA
ncbi:hypothetical protein AAVH_30661, partial [Aphelenchoides avenae]